MKKRDSDSSNRSGSSSSSGGRRRQFQQQSSLVSEDDGAESDRELITIIQQDDQELAEAKIRAKQGQQQQQVSRLPPATNRTTLNAVQTSGRDVVTILREDDQELAEAKARAYGNGASLEISPAAKPPAQGGTASDVATPETPADTTRHAAAPSPSDHADAPPSHRPSRQHTLNFLRDQDAKDKAAKANASDRGKQYTNRTQAAAVNMALRRSQQESLGNMIMVLDDDDQEEEEEKVEEGVLFQAMDDHNDFHGPSRGGFEPLVSSGNGAEESLPGAFRVGTSFAPASSEDDSDEADITWGDEEQEEAPFVGEPHRHRGNPASLMDQSQKEDEAEEDPLLPPQQSTDGDILVEATLVVATEEVQKKVQEPPQETIVVPEPELVTAERMSDAYSTHDMIKDQKGRRWLLGVGCLIAVVVIVAIIVIVAVAVGRKDKATTSGINNVPKPPIIPVETEAPTMAPTSFFLNVLPNYTQEAIDAQDTPQEAAYGWFLSDKEYWFNMTQEVNNTEAVELAQSFVPLERFALATLYYATGGASWVDSNNWLDHSQSSCIWHTTFFGSICSPGAQSRRQRNLRHRELQQDTAVSKLYYNRLSLNKNNLTGTFPPEVALLSNLDVINIHQNFIGGTIPTEFGSFQHLTLFQVFQNKLSGTIPTQLGLLPKVRQLNVAFNDLTGTIPTELGQLGASLQTLSTSNNPVEGVLPTELGLLTQLLGMFFYKNPNLTGPIPSELGALTAMTELQLNDASWTGVLPSQLGMVTGLKEIYLQNNIQLQGSIPESWENLTQLEQLWLHNTDLTGSVPAALCNLVDMGTLQRLTVDCLKVDCSCNCDCFQKGDPEGDESITEAPFLESSYNETNNQGGGETTEEELPQFDGPEEGEVTDVDIDYFPYDFPCDSNATSNETNDGANVDCGEDASWWDDDKSELELNSGEVNPDGPNGQTSGGEFTEMDEVLPPPSPDSMEETSHHLDGSGEVADIEPPEQLIQPPPVYATPPPEEFEFEWTDPPEQMMQSSISYSTPPPEDPPEETPSPQEYELEWTPPPEFFDENKDQPIGRSGSSNIFSH